MAVLEQGHGLNEIDEKRLAGALSRTPGSHHRDQGVFESLGGAAGRGSPGADSEMERGTVDDRVYRTGTFEIDSEGFEIAVIATGR
jgi:hypothetical protein